MKQKEELTPFGVCLFRVLPAIVILGVLCACLYFLVLPNLAALLPGRLGPQAFSPTVVAPNNPSNNGTGNQRSSPTAVPLAAAASFSRRTSSSPSWSRAPADIGRPRESDFR